MSLLKQKLQRLEEATGAGNKPWLALFPLTYDPDEGQYSRVPTGTATPGVTIYTQADFPKLREQYNLILVEYESGPIGGNDDNGQPTTAD